MNRGSGVKQVGVLLTGFWVPRVWVKVWVQWDVQLGDTWNQAGAGGDSELRYN